MVSTVVRAMPLSLLLLVGCAGVSQNDTPASPGDAGPGGGAESTAPVSDAAAPTSTDRRDSGNASPKPETGRDASVEDDCRGSCNDDCPERPPPVGDPCDATGVVCAYDDAPSCVCNGLGWQCQTCWWDAVSSAWLGSGCEPCPVVDAPEPDASYGPCGADAPTCAANPIGSFVCDGGEYRYRIASPPP